MAYFWWGAAFTILGVILVGWREPQRPAIVWGILMLIAGDKFIGKAIALLH